MHKVTQQEKKKTSSKQLSFTQKLQKLILTTLKYIYFKQALFNRGFAYDKLGSFDLAIKDYTKSIEIDSSNAYAYYNRAISYDKKGEIEKTIEDFSKAIKLIPTKADFYLNRGYS